MVEVMDEGIGEIMEALKEIGHFNNTIIVFVSDNGANRYGSNGNLRGFKASAYEGGSRVPAIFHYPERLNGGTVNNNTLMTMDLFPTLLDFINAEPKTKQIDGISIKKNLLENETLEERDLYFEFKNRSYVRRGELKLVLTKTDSGSKIELFNLETDVGESLDLKNENESLVLELLNSFGRMEIGSKQRS